MSTGKRVQALRQQRGWTQEQLGNRVGISRRTVMRLENEQRKSVPVPLAKRFARVFQQPWTEFVQ